MKVKGFLWIIRVLWIMEEMYIKGIAERGKHNGGKGMRSHGGSIVVVIMHVLLRL